MRTLDLNAYRNELACDILTMNNMEVLKSVRRAYQRAVEKTLGRAQTEELPAYTLEELNARIDEAEADFIAGKGIPTETAHARMKQIIAAL